VSRIDRTPAAFYRREMQVRMKRPTVGQRAWIHPLQGAEVAPGFPQMLPVTVESIRQEGLCFVTIRNGAGRTLELPHFELDCGQEYEISPGKWIPESDPRALDHVRACLSSPRVDAGNVNHEVHLEWLRLILARNGVG
jgi:hypothetical protein